MSIGDRDLRVGVDIGATKTLIALFEGQGKVLEVRKMDSEREKGYEFLVDVLAREIRDLMLKSEYLGRVERVGIACAGQIEHEMGIVKFSPNLNWRDVRLKEEVEKRIGISVFVENDVNAATYGEWLFSFGGRPKNVVGVWIGTGIGGGLILEGKIYRGSLGYAGEIGHMILNPYGYRCNCGSRGCFEAFCGGSYVVERVKKLLNSGYRGKIGELIKDKSSLTVSDIERAYRFGDESLGEIWKEVIDYLGFALASLANIFNPDMIILGGGVIDNTENLLSCAIEVFEKRAMRDTKEGLRIVKSELKELSAAKGVAFVDEF